MSKKFIFHRIGNEEHNGWYLLVNTSEILQIILDKRCEDLANAYMSMPEVKDGWGYENTFPENYDPKTKTGTHFQHGKPLEYLVMLWLGRWGEETPKEQKNLVSAMAYLEEKMNGGMIKYFASQGSLYVNIVGGYMPATVKHIEILETKESDDMIFPSTKKNETILNISKYTNGKHYYATLGSEDVVIDGKRSWNTYEVAVQCGQEFARNKGFTITKITSQ